MSIKEKLEKFLYGKVFERFILFLVTLSVSILFIEKAFELEVSTILIFEKLDILILTIFSIEFFFKLYINRSQYFWEDYGWIDLLSILPILAPAIKALRGIKLLRGIRVLRAIRLLKMLRLLRFLKLSKSTDSVLKQKVFVPISTSAMIIVLTIGFVLTNWIEDEYKERDNKVFKEIFIHLETSPSAEIMKQYPEVLFIRKNGKLIESRFPEIELDKKYLMEQIRELTAGELGLKSGTDIEITFSCNATYRAVKKVELFVMLISILVIVVLILVMNTIISNIILDPLNELSRTMDTIVKKVEVPNTKETRVEISYNERIESFSDDEIGVLSNKYNVLLETLKQKEVQSKTVFRNMVYMIMKLFGEFHNITKGHQMRTAVLASALGYKMGLSEMDRESLYYGMLLHDLVKTGIDKNVLTKPAILTPEERQEMNRHPMLGYEIAKDFPLINTAELMVIRDHHEKYDG
ncbi:MAG: ion transporter, partial [Leptospiraceae bacterium]|nr:ion transporter [Leptospiraceae bacterium]